MLDLQNLMLLGLEMFRRLGCPLYSSYSLSIPGEQYSSCNVAVPRERSNMFCPKSLLGSGISLIACKQASIHKGPCWAVGAAFYTRWFYMTSWMLFDLALIGFDYSFVSLNLGDTQFAVLRSARILRVLRLIRLIKLSKLNTLIEESAAAAGRQWVTMVVAITKTGVGMLVVAHWLTCFWYWTGVFLVPNSIPNWIQENRAEDVSGRVLKGSSFLIGVRRAQKIVFRKCSLS